MKDPPALTLRGQGKLISLHPRRIAVNALRDELEADKILEWLREEINQAWERREEIEPSYEGARKPKLLEILKILPRTNCQECGQPTCMVFSALTAEGVKGPEDCPSLDNQGRERLEEYLGQFSFDL